MALNLANMAGKTATVTVEFFGETAKITYDPMEITQESYTRSGKGDDEFVEFFCTVVKSWDVTLGNRKVPLNKAGLSKVPLPFLKAVYNAVISGSGGDEDEGKASSGT